MNIDQYRQLMGATPRRGVFKQETSKPQIRVPKLSSPNKTEASWMERCRTMNPGCAVLFEPFTLHLPSGTRYTPDVVVMRADTVVELWEVKGKHIHNQRSIHAWKEARAAFPFWKFGFAQLRGTEWSTTIEDSMH